MNKPPMGIIELDTPYAQEIGFTSDKFHGYLWGNSNSITISLITSRHEGQGNLLKLFDSILDRSLQIIVPTPFKRMINICERYGFHRIKIETEDGIVYAMRKVPNEDKVQGKP